MNALDAVSALQSFASNLEVTWKSGRRTTWARYLASNPRGNVDEDQLIRPRVFPSFAEEFLDFEVGVTLNAEQSSQSGRPDFTPLDQVTHTFVFEVKGTSDQLTTHDAQVRNYLSRPNGRVKAVVLTNMALIRVARLDANRSLVWDPAVNLRALIGSGSAAVLLPDAERLAAFLRQFSRVRLTTAEKLVRIRDAPPWVAAEEPTDPAWLTARIGVAVERIITDVSNQSSTLTDTRRTSAAQREAVLLNLQQLAMRLDVASPETLTLHDFLTARDDTPTGKTRLQFQSQVAYQYVARMVLSRVWEDLGIVAPANLYDGQFALRMDALGGVLAVINHAFGEAAEHYRPLFSDNPTHSWYRPTEEAAIDTLFELAMAYFGHITSDILGAVYETMLDRIDRKLLGQYYTPRDVISMMWSLVINEETERAVMERARLPVVLDIAAGSGGFLVEGAKRFRDYYNELVRQRANIDPHDWVDQTALALNGVEYQPFSAYLAEINLLIQFSAYLQDGTEVALPELGVIQADTLSLHNPDALFPPSAAATSPSSGVSSSRAARLRDPGADDGLSVDIAIGNPPYIGEKIGAAIMRRTRTDYPYWEQFVAAHLDYLYWFLILGVSKLRVGGRFAFITTDYWLRAEGASKLRGYLAERCRIERVILFRDLRLFPDAKGQHNMIIVGSKAGDGTQPFTPASPLVSIYDGPNLSLAERKPVLQLLADGRSAGASNVRSHRSRVSPNTLGAASWGDLSLTKSETAVRTSHRARASFPAITVEEGVIPTLQQLKSNAAAHLPAAVAVPGRGVQLLTPEEVAALGPLTQSEEAVLRRRINTADVYPYAAVVAFDADFLIYLPRPRADASAPLPADMPTIGKHLAQFQSLMEHTVAAWKDKRPWWSLHRAREATILRPPIDDAWEDYCLAPRWGNGSKLVVGLAPSGTVPASGLHLISTSTGHGLAPYLAAMINSTPIQALAAKLPPGHLRSAEMAALNIPDLGTEAVSNVTTISLRLAEIVTELVTVHAVRFPMLTAVLRSDITMQTDALWRWVPQPPPVAGSLSTRDWLHGITSHGKTKATIDAVAVEANPGQLLTTITLSNASVKAPGSVTLAVASETAADQVEALAALCAGATSLNGIGNLQVPLTLQQLSDAHQRDRQPVLGLLDEYLDLRNAIDNLLA